MGVHLGLEWVVLYFHAEKPQIIKEKAPHLSLECFCLNLLPGGHQQALAFRDLSGPLTHPAQPSPPSPLPGGSDPCWSPGHLGG